jgi:hypothetical protein
MVIVPGRRLTFGEREEIRARVTGQSGAVRSDHQTDAASDDLVIMDAWEPERPSASESVFACGFVS